MLLPNDTVTEVFAHAMHAGDGRTSAGSSSRSPVPPPRRRSRSPEGSGYYDRRGGGGVAGLVFSAWMEALGALCLCVMPDPYEQLHLKLARFLEFDIAQALHVNVSD